jgi:hypothetical protein
VTKGQIMRRYTHLASFGGNTIEKHIRRVAARLVDEVNGGFDTPLAGVHREVPWLRGVAEAPDLSVWIPAGAHGYALQLVIEEQLREGLA